MPSTSRHTRPERDCPHALASCEALRLSDGATFPPGRRAGCGRRARDVTAGLEKVLLRLRPLRCRLNEPRPKRQARPLRAGAARAGPPTVSPPTASPPTASPPRRRRETRLLTDHVVGNVDLDLPLILEGHLALDALVRLFLFGNRKNMYIRQSGGRNGQKAIVPGGRSSGLPRGALVPSRVSPGHSLPTCF